MSIPFDVSNMAGLPPSSSAAGSAAPDAARLEWLWSEYEKQMQEVKQYQEEGMDIFPTPGFVAKTLLLSAPTRPSPQFPALPPSPAGAAGLKLFVNVCSDPAIGTHTEHDADGNEQLRVPISAGPVSLDVEKDGSTPCLRTDVVLNPESVSRCTQPTLEGKEFRNFLVGFALQKIQEKFKVQLDMDQVKYPKMKYKGSLPPPSQYIRRPKTAHVEEEKGGKEGAGGQGEDAETALPTDEQLEERRRAAQLARIEALRAMEERESGIRMATEGQRTASTNNSVFLTQQQAEQAAAQGGPLITPLADEKETTAKIEVLQDEPSQAAANALAYTSAASSTAAAPSASSTAASASSPLPAATPVPASSTAATSASPSDPSLPSYSIFYLKSLDPSSTSQPIPASDWQLDVEEEESEQGAAEDASQSLPLPAAILVRVILPLLKSAAELEVEITSEGAMLYSKQKCADQHQYKLHVRDRHLHREQADMQFPFLLDADSSTCKFSKKTRTLTLTLPVTAKRPLPDLEPEMEDQTTAASTTNEKAAESTSTSTSSAAAAPSIDWQEKLGLTNTIMFQLVSE